MIAKHNLTVQNTEISYRAVVGTGSSTALRENIANAPVGVPFGKITFANGDGTVPFCARLWSIIELVQSS